MHAPKARQSASDPRVAGIGTKATGLVKGQWGPFQCGGCWKFDAEARACDHSEVAADPEAAGIVEFTEDGRPKVDEDDCCNKYWPTGVSLEEFKAGSRKSSETAENESRAPTKGPYH